MGTKVGCWVGLLVGFEVGLLDGGVALGSHVPDSNSSSERVAFLYPSSASKYSAPIVPSGHISFPSNSHRSMC